MLRVMLVDDEESALDYLELLLRMTSDIDIVARFMNPNQALEAVEHIQPDLIFLDIQMPGMSGMDLASRIRMRRPEVRFVFTTAYSEYAVNAFELNATDYLLKPFTKERLMNTLERVQTVQIPTASKASAEDLHEQQVWIQLMGGLYIHTPQSDSGLLSWKLHKEKELCAFLLQNNSQPMSADVILDAVWPESDPFKAKTYLYTCISYIRKTFQKQPIPIEIKKQGNDGYVLVLNGLPTDVNEFEQLLALTDDEGQEDEQLFNRLEELYKGGYLLNCDYPWAMRRKQQLQLRYLYALRTIYSRSIGRNDPILIEKCLKMILQLAPDSEREGRELILLYVQKGKRSEALRTYQRLEQELQHNLGVALEEETVQLYQQFIV